MANEQFKGPLVGNKWDSEIDVPLTGERLIGIEVEAECCVGMPNMLQSPENPDARAPLTPLAPRWAAVEDFSLRNNGAEFVSFPFCINQVVPVVTELFDYIGQNLIPWKGTVRTGIHVHVSVRDFDVQFLKNLLMVYTLMEPALFRYVGSEREECIYCVPWYRAPNDVKLAAQTLSPTKNLLFSQCLHQMSGKLAKYSAMYLSPITRIGTVEFRMAPTWLNKFKIVEWARICERIVSFSRECNTYYTILNKYDSDPSGFPEFVTGGAITAPDNYGSLLEKCGADLLARSLFPEPLKEWTRVMEEVKVPSSVSKSNSKSTFNPILAGKPIKMPKVSHANGQFYVGSTTYTNANWLDTAVISKPKPPKPKIGDTKNDPGDPITYQWNGSFWGEVYATIPDGWIKKKLGKLYQWNAAQVQWVPLHNQPVQAPAEISWDDPPDIEVQDFENDDDDDMEVTP